MLSSTGSSLCPRRTWLPGLSRLIHSWPKQMISPNAAWLRRPGVKQPVADRALSAGPPLVEDVRRRLTSAVRHCGPGRNLVAAGAPRRQGCPVMELPEIINAGDLLLQRWEPAWAQELTAAVRDSLPELKPFLP